MSKSVFSFSEMVYNSICTGRVMYVKDDQGNNVKKTIDYIKALKDLRILEIHFTDGEVVQVKEDEDQMFEVNNRKQWARGKAKRLTGRDVWGTEEVER